MTPQEHDLEIVRAAEAWVEDFEGVEPLIAQGQVLRQAILDKREAMRPRCDWAAEEAVSICAAPAIQAVTYINSREQAIVGIRCVKHRVTVTEL